MDNKQQLEALEEKIVKLKYDITQFGYDLKDKADEIKSAKSKIPKSYSTVGSLIWICISLTITIAVCFFLFKWWISTAFSALEGFIAFLVAGVALIWDIAVVITSSKGYYNKMLAKHNKQLNSLLEEKEEIISKQYALKKEINTISNDIHNIEQVIKKEEEEKQKKLEEEKQKKLEEEKRKKEELEARFKKAINSERIDRKELKAIADAGHIKAKIEMAKILIDDYFSKMYTKEEKERLASTALKYLKGLNTEKNVEVELLELFSYTMCSCIEGGIFMKSNLKKIREIKENNTLSEKYDSLANNMILHIVSVIENHDHSSGTAINYSYSTSNDDSNSSLCAHYQNGSCKRGRNAYYDNISCGYSECFQSVCPNYQKR